MDPTLAEIRLFAGNFAPLSWAFCNGQLMSIAQNTALFSLIGTIYGGDGQTTFALPNFQGRTAIGTGNGPGLTPVDLGQVSGNNSVTLTSQNLAQHTHMAELMVTGNGGTSSSPTNAVFASGVGTTSDGQSIQISASNTATDGSNMTPVISGSVGASQPVPITNPYLGLYYIIAVEGIYPSRN